MMSLGTVLAGCGAKQSADPNVGPGISSGHANGILGQAEFTLDCPRDEIHLTKLAHWRVGASGCGSRAVYVYVSGVGWVQD